MATTIEFDGFTFKEANLGLSASRGSSFGDTIRFVVRSGSPALVAEAYARYIESLDGDPGDYDLAADLVGDEWTILSVSFKYKNPAPLSFSTTGATTHLNQSYGTRAKYSATGTAPDYQGAIGVDSSGVAGVDVTVPAFNFSVRRRFKFVSTTYLSNIVALTGKVNDGPWSVFAAGEVLFLGAEGGEDEQNYVDLTYQFAARGNQTGLTFGDVTGVAKRGWDYLWCRHSEKVVGDLVLMVPTAVYIEKVYPEGDFASLGALGI